MEPFTFIRSQTKKNVNNSSQQWAATSTKKLKVKINLLKSQYGEQKNTSIPVLLIVSLYTFQNSFCNIFLHWNSLKCIEMTAYVCYFWHHSSIRSTWWLLPRVRMWYFGFHNRKKLQVRVRKQIKQLSRILNSLQFQRNNEFTGQIKWTVSFKSKFVRSSLSPNWLIFCHLNSEKSTSECFKLIFPIFWLILNPKQKRWRASEQGYTATEALHSSFLINFLVFNFI